MHREVGAIESGAEIRMPVTGTLRFSTNSTYLSIKNILLNGFHPRERLVFPTSVGLKFFNLFLTKQTLRTKDLKFINFKLASVFLQMKRAIVSDRTFRMLVVSLSSMLNL